MPNGASAHAFLRFLVACVLFSTLSPSSHVLPSRRIGLYQVYMGAELEERPKQGLVTQTVSKIVMSFAKQARTSDAFDSTTRIYHDASDSR